MKNKAPDFGRYSHEDEKFNEILNFLSKKYFHNGGDEDAEIIVNWSKMEAQHFILM